MTDRARYVDVAETAGIVRARLKREFPSVRFSVRSRRYAGGASITVSWKDGPLVSEVAPITSQYKGAGFDGIIDMKHHREHWLRPDGTVMIRHDPGTTGSMGMTGPLDNRELDDTMPEDAERVRFGADHINTSRQVSNREQKTAAAIEWIYEHCVVTQRYDEPEPNQDRYGDAFVIHVADRLVANQKDGEDLRAAYNRCYGATRAAA